MPGELLTDTSGSLGISFACFVGAIHYGEHGDASKPRQPMTRFWQVRKTSLRAQDIAR